MLQAPNFGIQRNKEHRYKCKKMKFIKTVIGEEVARLKLRKFTCFIRFVMYRITTCSVECYLHCNDEAVHFKSDDTEFLLF